MFTGIIEEVGIIKSISNGTTSAKLEIQTKIIMDDIRLGDSIAVNGVCLTVCNLTSNSFEADVMNETLKRTSLGLLTKGSKVNLERAMSANGRFGGHIVSGHIDGIGTIKSFTKDGIATILTISTSSKLIHYIIEKGSIAIDGASLTVSNVIYDKNEFEVSLIPHTKENTILLSKHIGSSVNLENDVVGKYIDHFLHPEADVTTTKKSNITKEFLAEYGF